MSEESSIPAVESCIAVKWLKKPPHEPTGHERPSSAQVSDGIIRLLARVDRQGSPMLADRVDGILVTTVSSAIQAPTRLSPFDTRSKRP